MTILSDKSKYRLYKDLFTQESVEILIQIAHDKFHDKSKIKPLEI